MAQPKAKKEQGSTPYPKKSLGQHFLTSTGAVTKMVGAGEVKAGDLVLEIGPGRGVLTKALLSCGAVVIAVEKDDQLVVELGNLFAQEVKSGQLTIIHQDILETDTESVIQRPYKLVANIPYYITGQILRMFLESEHQPQSMTLLVQKEVGERIARSQKESLLSLSVKVYGTPTYIQTVSRGSFNPPPNVDSAILHIADISRKNFTAMDEKHFFALLHAGFAHKRKQLLPNLTSLYTKDALASAFAKLSISLKVRAEDVPLETWLQLNKILS